MTRLDVEGELSSLSAPQLTFIKEVLENRGYINNKVVIKPVGAKGDNYVATVLRISVEDDDGVIFNMVAKVSSSVETLRSQMNQGALFANEILMYKEVLPKFNELQVAAGIPENERLRFPICYGCLTEEPHEIILLEDLSESGFGIFNRMKPLSEESINLAIKNIALLHTLSFVLKYKEPQTFDSYSDRLFNLYQLMMKNPDMALFFTMIENDLIAVLDEDKHKNMVKNLVSQVPTISAKLDELLKISAPKYSVILQGDCWGNNIMFKLHDAKPVSAVLIDYQISREGSPVIDLFYLILNCCSYDTPSERVKRWFDLYYSELDTFLKKFSLDVATVYPRDKFDSDLKIHAKLGLGQKCMLASVLVREGKDIVDMQDVTDLDFNDAETLETYSITKKNDETKDRLRKGVSGVIDNLLELGYL